MCQNDPPKWPANITRHGNLLDSPARITRRIYLPEKTSHFNSRLACQRSPLPCSKSPGRTWLAIPPPPLRLRQRSGGRGQGAGPAHPRILNSYFSFLFHISWMATYSCITQYIHILHRADWMKYKYVAVGEGIIARRGWGAGLLPAPLKGMFCIF